MQNQVHDFTPPIPPSGLFWTIPIPASSAHIDLANATAAFVLRKLSVPDWGNLRYATTDGPHVPATVSFIVRWNGVIARARRRNVEQRWTGEYINTNATITWSAREEGFRFDSDAASTTKTNAAVMGRHRSGVFFS